MDKIHKKILLLFSIFFFGYFYSESVLRQASMSLLDKDKIKIETVIGKLPQGLREDVKKKIEIGALQDAIKSAREGSPEHASALINLAFAVEDKFEREKIYLDVIQKYPELPESLNAYTFFLLNDTSSNPVSIEDYHAYINASKPESRLAIWGAGLSKLKIENASKEEQWKFLFPLFSYKPDYREYQSLYEQLYELAIQMSDNKAAELAETKANECLDLSSINEILSKMGKEEKKK